MRAALRRPSPTGSPRPRRQRIAQKRQAAELLFHRVGITFAVYGEASGAERLIPFDILPHVIPGAEWDAICGGAAGSA